MFLIIFYKDPSTQVEWDQLDSFLKRERLDVTLREDLFLNLGEEKIKYLAQRMAEIRLLGNNEKTLNSEPFQVEIDYELRNLKREDRKIGPVYSGFHFQSILREILVGGGSLPVESLHIIFTNQRLATWGEDRWHLRTILLGFPSIISTTGLIEAPARERDYYLLKSVDPSLGERWLEEDRDHLERDDPRLTMVIKGYLWQAIFYGIQIGRGVQLNAPTKNRFSFCKNPECSLYNSHWQREVLMAQYGGRLCEKHSEMKNSMRS